MLGLVAVLWLIARGAERVTHRRPAWGLRVVMGVVVAAYVMLI